MALVTFTIVFQAVASGLFLIRYTMLIKWWKTVSGHVLAGLLMCLFILTLTLSITSSDEGLKSTPLAVTIGRIGFGVICTYGLIALEYRNRGRK